jgi:hypothetical protein
MDAEVILVEAGVVDSGTGADAKACNEVVARPLDGQSGDVVVGHGQGEAVEAISVTSFIQSLKLPMHALVTFPPRQRVSRCVDSVSVPRSDRLVAKTAMRDPKPEVQVRKVLLKKMEAGNCQLTAEDPEHVGR